MRSDFYFLSLDASEPSEPLRERKRYKEYSRARITYTLSFTRGPVVLGEHLGAEAVTDGQISFSTYLFLTSLCDPPLLRLLLGEHWCLVSSGVY